MARPRVFISSTYYDLRHIRTSLESFVGRLGYEAIVSEKGRIAYDPDLPLDESCYREASRADLFVLIIGGRYGSPASEDNIDPSPAFYERYESITKKEYEAAAAGDIPTYILVDTSVMTEFDTFKKNRNRTDIEYAHVESVNVFHLLEEILGRTRNNAAHQFERNSEIEEWLREQWAGLFQEFLTRRSEQKQLVSLSDRVAELSSLNSSLKRYLEAIISRVSTSEGDAETFIQSEQERLASEMRLRDFFKIGIVRELFELVGLDKDFVMELYSSADSIDNLTERLDKATDGAVGGGDVLRYWRERPDLVEEINMARSLLGRPPLTFRKSKKSPRVAASKEKARQEHSSDK